MNRDIQVGGSYQCSQCGEHCDSADIHICILDEVSRLCGWRDCYGEGHMIDYMWAPGHISRVQAHWTNGKDYLINRPDYLNDLNACATFEQTAPLSYWEELSNITGAGGMSISLQQFKRIGTATARQRCQAFVDKENK